MIRCDSFDPCEVSIATTCFDGVGYPSSSMSPAGFLDQAADGGPGSSSKRDEVSIFSSVSSPHSSPSQSPCQSSDKASIVNKDKTYLPKMSSFFGLANVQSILMFDYSWPTAQANQMTTEQKSFAAEWPANFWEKMEKRDKE